MKTIICFICAAIATSALASHPQTKLSGVTYEVEIVRNNGSTTKGCMTFHESGRLTMPDESLTMLWSTQVDFSNRFMAVTAPGERTVVPYHEGVYGEVFSDNTLKGRGIDQSGRTFAFYGKANGDCVASRLDAMARAANNTITEQTVTNQTSLPAQSLPILDPCWTPPGYHVPCDPTTDPQRAVDPGTNQPVQLLDPCQMADGSWTPCDPIADPLRAVDPGTNQPVQLLDPCQMADGSWTPCDPIDDPLRALDPSLGEPIRLLNPCQMADSSRNPCDLIVIIDPRRAVDPGTNQPVELLDPCQMADGSWTPCDPIADPLRAANPSPSKPIRILDPCQMPNGSWTPCDPIPDPLRDDVHNNVTPATLAGRSFRLTLGTSNRSVLEYCWTFTQKHQIETANQAVLTWSPDISPSYDASFISTGAGGHGQGMAYQGTLVGNDLLEVVGIEARDGKTFVTYGFGQEVASCK